MKKVYLIGAGQIGSRHLQALKSVSQPLSIKVIDPFQNSLDVAKQRYEEMPAGEHEHEVSYHTEIPSDGEEVDLAFITTSAKPWARHRKGNNLC